MHAGTCNDHVTVAGQPTECFRFCAHCNTKPRDLRDTARHQSRFRVVAVSDSVGDSSAQRDDVLQRTAHFHTAEIIIGIDSESVRHENILNVLCSRHILRRNDNGRRKESADFFRVRRTGKRNVFQITSQNMCYFRKTKQCRFFNALCHIDNYCFICDVWNRMLKNSSELAGRRCKQHNVSTIKCFIVIRRQLKILFKLHARQIVFVFPVTLQFLDLFRSVRRQSNIVTLFCQHNR